LKESSIASQLDAFSSTPFPTVGTENLCTTGQDLPEQHLVLPHILQCASNKAVLPWLATIARFPSWPVVLRHYLRKPIC